MIRSPVIPRSRNSDRVLRKEQNLSEIHIKKTSDPFYLETCNTLPGFPLDEVNDLN